MINHTIPTIKESHVLISTTRMNKQQQDYHADQKNPNNPARAAAQDNRADQKNPNNPAFKK